MHPDSKWLLQQFAIATVLMSFVMWLTFSLVFQLRNALPPCNEQISRCVR